MATEFNKISSGYQVHQVVEWQVNVRFQDYLFPCHQVADCIYKISWLTT